MRTIMNRLMEEYQLGYMIGCKETEGGAEDQGSSEQDAGAHCKVTTRHAGKEDFSNTRQ